MIDQTQILIVGAGPVGLVTALLLARCGWRVTVLERFAAAYPRPRAVHFDDEVARLFADAGIGDSLPALTEPADIYEWRNAKAQTLLRFDWRGTGPSGWPIASMVYQPQLEDALTAASSAIPGLTLLRGHQVMRLTESGDQVEVVARDAGGHSHVFTASWVIGCDGANSFVRDQMSVPTTGLGFFYDWLIVDVVPHESRDWDPTNLQICDPARPTTVVSGGPGRRRWEFMRMPDETIEQLNTEETAWRLLAPWGLTQENATLERHTVYTFEARWAQRWRSGRRLLAGDAAHLMPPFAGQGMCSGIRDATNLAWKLDLVLQGLAAETLLDTYGTERVAHVQHAIGMSVELGKVICVTNPELAAQRDDFMISQSADPARILPPLPPPTLITGVIRRTAEGQPDAGAGLLTPQPRIAQGDRTGLLDNVLGRGFVLACLQNPSGHISDEQLAFLEQIGAHVIHMLSNDQPGSAPRDGQCAVDLDGVLTGQMAGVGAVAALIRPDHYLFGTASSLEGVDQLVEDLRRQLAGLTPEPSSGRSATVPSSSETGR